MRNQVQQIYETSDICLSGCLLTNGITLKGAYKREDSACVFQFLIPSEKSSIIQDYWSRKILVDPQLFHANLKSLRTMISQSLHDDK